MPTIQIKVTATTSVSNTKTISQSDLDRFIAAYNKLLGQVSDGQGGVRDRTSLEVFNGWSNGLFQGTIDNVKAQERSVVINTITSVSMT